MYADLLRPPTHLSPAEALHISQQAPAILQKRSSWSLPWPFSIFTSPESPETWTKYENLMLTCLRTGDNNSALACLEKLKDRFGEGNDRVMGLVGLYHEAIAPDDKALNTVLMSYEEAIEDRPANMVVRKRHVALLRSMGKLDGATNALVDLLAAVPIDAEAWAELAELYFIQGLYAQAIFSLEETLLVTPNAWNVHARLGEVIFITSQGESNDTSAVRTLSRSFKSFCRSIELCDDYLRGFYGLKLVTNKLMPLLEKFGKSPVSQKDEEIAPPSLSTVQKLNELATAKLAEIVRKHSTGAEEWKGYEESEIIAARELLDRDTGKTVR